MKVRDSKRKKRKPFQKSTQERENSEECEICGFDQVTDLHHVGGCETKLITLTRDPSDPEEIGWTTERRIPRTDEVIRLCPNCHALTHRKGYTPSQVYEVALRHVMGLR